MAAFEVPARRHIAEIEIKKSRFICVLDYAESKRDLKALLAFAKTSYPDARHYCWAYSAFDGRDEGMSDDGEPKGTAGRPMLIILQHAKLSNVAAVVVRYFGGVKLGTGGLARAYSEAVKVALEEMISRPYFDYCHVFGRFDFSDEHQLRYLAKTHRAEIVISYEDGLKVDFQVRANDVTELTSALAGQFPHHPIQTED